MEFEEVLRRLGFELAEERPAARLYSSQRNPFLTFWVHAFEDGTALFTWEFAVVDFLARHGIQLGSGESLNLFMFPMTDDRGPQDGAWLASALDRAEERLRSLRFDEPEPDTGT